MTTMTNARIGIDLGGTKIEAVVLDRARTVRLRRRIPTPAGDYLATVAAVAELVRAVEHEAGAPGAPVGVGHPGSISPRSGLIRNASSTCLNGQPLQQDLSEALGRSIRMANDADCLALSEAADGAAAGARTVFAAILGTGVGGGIAWGAIPIRGPNAIAGEWGHNPLPWPRPEWNEWPGTRCWCGQSSCIETWLSGTGLAADHHRVTSATLTAEEVAKDAEAGDAAAFATLGRYEDRLARALAQVINLLDPEVIVLGGGVSRVPRLYQSIPALWDQWVFSMDPIATRLVPALHGDSSGVLGAARLWPD